MTIQEYLDSIKADKNFTKFMTTNPEADIKTWNELYRKLQDKYITTKYVPYTTKTAICAKIVDYSSFTEVEGVKMVKVNTPLRNMLYTLNLIDIYTDIDVDYEHGVEIFDTIQESDELNVIRALIPQEEVKIFDSVMEMTLDDFEVNNFSIPSYLDTKLAALNISSGAILDTIKTILESKEEQ